MSWFTDLRDKVENSFSSQGAATTASTANAPTGTSTTVAGGMLSNPIALIAGIGIVIAIVYLVMKK